MDIVTSPGSATGVHSDPRVGRAPIIVVSPSDGRVVGEVPDRTPAEVRALAGELRSAQPEWEALGARERARWLHRFRDWLLDNDTRLAELVQAETGKAWGDATGVEIPPTVEIINYYAANAEKFLAERRVGAHALPYATKRLTTVYRPYPLVGVITPWNFPLAMPAMDVVPALLAGCAVISKPSEVTPLTWAECVRGWREDVGAPPVLGVATGTGQTGTALVDEVDYVMFTGSTETGRHVARQAADRLIPCSLELGGKDPMIVCADADLDRAAAGAAWGGLFNSGQVCVSVERVYVEEPVYDEFLDLLVERVSSLRQGTDIATFAADIGAMANETQLGLVQCHVDDARDKGARILTGGTRRPGAGVYFEPTVLADVDHSMACMTEETFGPTLPVMKVADSEAAIAFANDSKYGLMGSIWTRDRRKAEDLARRLDVGSVNINNVVISAFQLGLPFGGWKESGVGYRLGGPDGILKFCQPKAIVSDRLELKTEPNWYPYTPIKRKIIGVVGRLFGAGDLRRRLGFAFLPTSRTDIEARAALG